MTRLAEFVDLLSATALFALTTSCAGYVLFTITLWSM